MVRTQWLACAGLAVLAVSAWSAEERRLTLDGAVAQAQERHPSILQARRDVEAARGRRMQLAAVGNPELSIEALGLPLWNSEGETEFSLGLSQTVENPRRRAARRAIGVLGEDRARLELERARNIVRWRVERAYFEAVFAAESLAGLESLLATLEDFAGLALERYKAGQVAYLDVVRGRLEVLRARNEIVEGRRGLRERMLALNLLLGEPGETPLRLATPLEFVPLGRGWDEVKAAALAGSSVRLAAGDEKLAGRNVVLARTLRLPDFSLGLFLPSKRLGGWGVEFGLSLPLRRRGPRGALVEAEALAGRAAVAAQARSRTALAAVERAYADARALEEQIGVFRDSLLREVEDSVKTGLINYRYGTTDFFGVLDIVRSLKEVRLEYLRAILNHRLSLVDIASAGDGMAFESGERD